MEATLTYIALAIFLIVGTMVALVSKKYLKKEPKDFYAAGGRFGTLLASLSYAATTYSAFMFIGLVGLAYSGGVGAMGFELVYFVGTLFLLFFLAPKYWTLHNKYGFYSPAEVLSERYGSKVVGVAVTLLCLIALIPYASAQVIGIAYAAEGASGGAVPYTLAVVLAIALALAWSVIAGIWSIGWTDVFQGLLMLITGVIMVVWVYQWGFGGIGFDLAKLGDLSFVPNQTWSFTYFLNLTVPWFFFAVTNPQAVQRLFAPKDKRALKGMMIWFGIYGLFFTFLVTFLGLMLRGMSIEGAFPFVAFRDSVTPTLLALVPLWLGMLGLVAVIAASVSTIDAILLSLSCLTVNDLLGAYRPNISKRGGILAGRAVIALFAVACALFAMARPGLIVDLSVLSSALLLPQVPVILGAFFWKRGGRLSAVAAIATGFSVSVALYFLKMNPLDVPMNVWTVFIASLAYVLVAKFENAPDGVERFLEA
jgi:SSS family solute:Na+ symporter